MTQLLAETALLCLLGGAAGVGLAFALIRASMPLLSESLPYTADVRLDLRVFVFAAAATLAVTAIVGVLPALRASLVDLAYVLNQSGRGSSGRRSAMRRAIVVAEVALSLVLVCGALLLFRSLSNLQRLDAGVRVENVLTMSFDLPARQYATPASAALLYGSLVDRVAAAPGVERAALSTHLPLRWIGNGEAIAVAGVDERINVRFKRVDDGYFDALDIPVIAGRGFTPGDRGGAPLVAAINEALAARLAEAAGITAPVGRTVQFRYTDYLNQDWRGDLQIQGIIRSERVGPPWRPDPPVLYVPLAQFPVHGVRLIVRTAGDPASVAPAVRAAAREVAPDLPLGDVATMEQIRDRTYAGTSRPARLIGAFAAVAVVLAALGLYGVLTQSVAERRREIGIRMALGASSRDVVRHVVGNALSMGVAGLGLGLIGAFASTRLMQTFLFQVSPVDPLAFTLACVSLLLICACAAFMPAARAARVHPIAVLREEGS